ncbi:hypothetical protein BP5796_12186 [Coleophoma crateriformis]|uniref:Cupin type-2 domain-containing protein n=1 Tax=Coleophoma crateriformis TaxID=565419 RepID=A0A3D8QBP1_9HELO|nr:hypothetical protein BP5796_12186 [Coleophoma crateriformis]
MPQPGPTKSDIPFANVSLIKYKAPTSEVIRVGPIRLDVLEDGRNTDQRIGAVFITVPPSSPGPPQHWHQMHDETFLIIKGTGTFTSRTEKIIANVGDYVIVPPHSPHTFANDSPDEELIMYNSFTPAYYVNYFRLMAEMVKNSSDGKLTPSMAKEAMLHYATLQTD